MNAAAYSIVHNPILYEFYRKNRTESKLHLVAFSHVAKRIVRLIFHLEKHHLDFDLAKMRQLFCWFVFFKSVSLMTYF